MTKRIVICRMKKEAPPRRRWYPRPHHVLVGLCVVNIGLVLLLSSWGLHGLGFFFAVGVPALACLVWPRDDQPARAVSPQPRPED